MPYFIADNIITSLGFTSDENIARMRQGVTGIRKIHDPAIYPEPFVAAMVDSQKLDEKTGDFMRQGQLTRAEKMAICSIRDALMQAGIDAASPRTGFIISTTKGNIDLIEKNGSKDFNPGRELLWQMAAVISRTFQNPNPPLVVSNACISGVLAINIGAGWIQDRKYDHVVVCGVDIVSRFVVSGFMSFLSLSPKPCKPFDKERDGLSLGEGAGTIVLSREDITGSKLLYLGGGSANDANHISGPSRTGEGSFLAIMRALDEAKINRKVIDHISAHGTATVYNDEMESISINRHHMQDVPVSSFKGFWGHTLGAAGVVETAALLYEMRRNALIASKGYQNHGVSKPLNVVTENEELELGTCLKMASGFGGSNAALIIQKR